MLRPTLLPTLGLAAALAACGGASDQPAPDPAATPDASPPSSSPVAVDDRDLAAYPQAYRTMDLPALPGATVTSTGRQTTSLRDGIVIQLTTEMSVSEASEFYREALTSRGWAEETGPGQAARALLPDLPLQRLSFVDGPLSYAVTLTANDGTTQVLINLIER